MILILSDQNDTSTNDVIDWLNYYGTKWFRVNAETLVNSINIKFTQKEVLITLEFENNIVQLTEIKAFWYRRGDLTLNLSFLDNVNNDIEKFLNHEWKIVKNYLYDYFNKIPNIGNWSLENNNNKLIQLDYARQVGLDIPHSVITTNKKHIEDLISSYGVLITKAIDYSFSTLDGNYGYSNGETKKIVQDDLHKITNLFAPSLIQNYIDKKYELRIFYLLGEFYTMCIFSQQNADSITDYRNYSDSDPVRNVPYLLPKKIKTKLNRLMKNLAMNTGSIDIIFPNRHSIFFRGSTFSHLF